MTLSSPLIGHSPVEESQGVARGSEERRPSPVPGWGGASSASSSAS